MSTTKLWVFVAFCHVPSHIGLWAQMHMGTHMHTHSHWLKQRGGYSQEAKGTDFLLHWFQETSSWEPGRPAGKTDFHYKEKGGELSRTKFQTEKSSITQEWEWRKEIFTDEASGEFIVQRFPWRSGVPEIMMELEMWTLREAGNLSVLFTRPEPTLLCFYSCIYSIVWT